MHRHRRKLYVAAELALIEQIADTQRRRLHQPLEIGEVGYGGEFSQIALKIRRDVSVEPQGAVSRRKSSDGNFGESTACAVFSP